MSCFSPFCTQSLHTQSFLCLRSPAADQRQEEEFPSFKGPNRWATSGCSRKPTCLDIKTEEEVTLFCPVVNWHHVLRLWKAKMSVLIFHLNLLSFSGRYPTLLWIFLINGSVQWDLKSVLSLAKDLASGRLPAFFLDQLNWTSILFHIHELKWHLNR